MTQAAPERALAVVGDWRADRRRVSAPLWSETLSDAVATMTARRQERPSFGDLRRKFKYFAVADGGTAKRVPLRRSALENA